MEKVLFYSKAKLVLRKKFAVELPIKFVILIWSTVLLTSMEQMLNFTCIYCILNFVVCIPRVEWKNVS